jgi:translocator protein
MLKSWMVIAAVTLVVALAANIFRPKDVKWFNRQQRPRWLTFEKLIPLIWTVIFVCGGWSAYIVWERDPGSEGTWFLMAFYLLLEIVIVAYTPATLWLKSLRAGTYVGAAGFVLGLILTLLVIQVSGWAALLLLPYLLWSPIGTYTTWEMDRLNSNP